MGEKGTSEETGYLGPAGDRRRSAESDLPEKMVPGYSQRFMEGDTGDGKGSSWLGQHNRSRAADLGWERWKQLYVGVACQSPNRPSASKDAFSHWLCWAHLQPQGFAALVLRNSSS